MMTARKRRSRAWAVCLAMLCVVVTVAMVPGFHQHDHDDCWDESCTVCCLIHAMQTLLGHLALLLVITLIGMETRRQGILAACVRFTVPLPTLITLKVRLNP